MVVVRLTTLALVIRWLVCVNVYALSMVWDVGFLGFQY
jgi:hypothetical protein